MLQPKLKNKRIEKAMLNHDKRLVILAVLTIAVLTAAIFLIQSHSGQTNQPKAAIIDQLGSSRLNDNIRFANSTFVNTARELLHERFSSIDYYSDNATVDNYRKLPSMKYGLIVWRAHSALDQTSKYVAISTSERYTPIHYTRYLENEQLTLCNITGDPDLYYGITPKFVREIMIGRFEKTVLILLSCNGLKEGYVGTASTFREKGVDAVLSWDDWVSSLDNDNAGTILLEQLIRMNSTIDEAVSKIPPSVTEFGQSQLTYIPRPDAANYRIPQYSEETVTGAVKIATTPIHARPRFNFC